MRTLTEEQRLQRNKRARKSQLKYKEARRAARLAKYAENPELYRKRAREVYARRKEKARAVSLAYYHKHRTERLKKQKAYRLKNLEAMKQRSIQWAKDHPEEKRIFNRLRASHLGRVVIRDLTRQQWLTIQESQQHRCYYCDKRCKGQLTQDHLTPLSKGGNHTLSNVIGACRSCNSKKGIGGPLIPVQPFFL